MSATVPLGPAILVHLYFLTFEKDNALINTKNCMDCVIGEGLKHTKVSDYEGEGL